MALMPPEHLIFKSTDGSLTGAGVLVLAVGIFSLVATVIEIVAAIHWTRRPLSRPLRIRLAATGVLGLIAGTFFVVWPFIASPGRLY